MFRVKSFSNDNYSQLEDGLKFVAISHVWGVDHANVQLFCGADANTLRTAKMPAGNTLARVADISSYVGVPVWVDFLSIEQNNPKIQDAQMMLMDKIYERAEKTYILLPDSDFRFLQQIMGAAIRDDPNMAFFGKYNHKRFVEKLFTERTNLIYPSRVWTLQEALLSSRAIFVNLQTGERIRRSQFWKDVDSAVPLVETFRVMRKDRTFEMDSAKVTQMWQDLVTWLRLAFGVDQVQSISYAELCKQTRSATVEKDYVYGVGALLRVQLPPYSTTDAKKAVQALQYLLLKRGFYPRLGLARNAEQKLPNTWSVATSLNICWNSVFPPYEKLGEANFGWKLLLRFEDTQAQTGPSNLGKPIEIDSNAVDEFRKRRFGEEIYPLIYNNAQIYKLHPPDKNVIKYLLKSRTTDLLGFEIDIIYTNQKLMGNRIAFAHHLRKYKVGWIYSAFIALFAIGISLYGGLTGAPFLSAALGWIAIAIWEALRLIIFLFTLNDVFCPGRILHDQVIKSLLNQIDMTAESNLAIILETGDIRPLNSREEKLTKRLEKVQRKVLCLTLANKIVPFQAVTVKHDTHKLSEACPHQTSVADAQIRLVAPNSVLACWGISKSNAAGYYYAVLTGENDFAILKQANTKEEVNRFQVVGHGETYFWNPASSQNTAQNQICSGLRLV